MVEHTGMDRRIRNIDAIRGAALLGIFIVNIQAFSSLYYGSGLLPPDGRNGMDATLAFIISTVFELKFYLLFSYLFGYSMTLQIQSAERLGISYVPRILRRQAGLFVIGVVHAVLLFQGDILTTYALLGLLLLAQRNRPDTAKLKLAFGIIGVTAAVWLMIALVQWSEPARDDSEMYRSQAEAAMLSLRATPRDIIGQHLSGLWALLPMLLALQGPCALAMFLLGFISGDHRLLQYPERYAPHLNRVILWGMLVGIPGGLAYAWGTQFMPGSAAETAMLALGILTAPFLAMGFLAMLLKLFDSGRVECGRNALASAGRMALSNYLLQSLICAFLFQGYGLGLIGKVTVTQTFFFVLPIFGLQLLMSRWWLTRFTCGPVEWILRAMTIGRWSSK